MSMNSLIFSFFEVCISAYILSSILFCITLNSMGLYAYPRLLSVLSTSSIFVFIGLLFLVMGLNDCYFTLFWGLLNVSPFNSFFEILLTCFGCFILVLNRSYYSKNTIFEYEFDILFIFSFLGLSILCMSNDLLVIYMAIELQSLAFYVLSTLKKNSELSNEAGLKYFILGSFSSCFLLLGFSLIYLSLGSTSFL